MRQVAARVKHPCFGVRVASVHKINRLHLENVACRGEKLLFEKTVFGMPDWIRTSGLQSRSLTLYPTELRAHIELGRRG